MVVLCLRVRIILVIFLSYRDAENWNRGRAVSENFVVYVNVPLSV